jgi:hypothetical protein
MASIRARVEALRAEWIEADAVLPPAIIIDGLTGSRRARRPGAVGRVLVGTQCRSARRARGLDS